MFKQHPKNRFPTIPVVLDDFQGLEDLKRLLSEINNKIEAQQIKILLARCEVTNVEKVIVQTLADDDISKTQINFKAVEVEYFHTVMREIVKSEERRLQTIACLNLVKKLMAKLSKSDAERFLEKCERMGYLVTEVGYVHLGPRCILEFAPYFRTHCQDCLKYCELCSDIVFTVRVLWKWKLVRGNVTKGFLRGKRAVTAVS